MGALRRENGAVNLARARVGTALQSVRNVSQERVAPIDSDRFGRGENSIQLGIGQANR